MSPFFAVVKKELYSVLRDRTILIAILLQLFIASFSSGLLLGMLSLYDADTIMRFGGSAIRVGMVAPVDEQLLGQIVKRGLRVVQFEDINQARSAFFQGRANLIIDTPRETNNLTEIAIYLPDSNTISSLIRMVIQEPLKQYENYLRTQKGIDVYFTDLQGKPSTSFEFVYSALLPMLMFFPAFVAGSMSIDSLTEEIENNTLKTLLSAPLTVAETVGAKITSVIILSALQCGTWLLLLKSNGIAIQNSGWIFLLAVIVSGITATSGALGAVFLRDRERSQFTYALILLGAVALGNLLNISPIITLSRLAVGDQYISGWNIVIYAILSGGLYVLLRKASHRLLV